MAHELAVNADIQQKLYFEIKKMNDELDDGKIINYEQIQSLKYMDQVLCETLRKWPPSPVRKQFREIT
jgi:cytochrome P450